MAWKEDVNLKNEMENYAREGLQLSEMIDFLKRDFSHYKWSIRSLDRRLRFFEIYYNDKNVPVEDVVDAVQKELDGPGALLGYWAVHKKIRQQHNIKVPRDAVYTVMTSGEASPTIWSCYANFSVFIDRIRNQFLEK